MPYFDLLNFVAWCYTLARIGWILSNDPNALLRLVEFCHVIWMSCSDWLIPQELTICLVRSPALLLVEWELSSTNCLTRNMKLDMWVLYYYWLPIVKLITNITINSTNTTNSYLYSLLILILSEILYIIKFTIRHCAVLYKYIYFSNNVDDLMCQRLNLFLLTLYVSLNHTFNFQVQLVSCQLLLIAPSKKHHIPNCAMRIAKISFLRKCVRKAWYIPYPILSISVWVSVETRPD